MLGIPNISHNKINVWYSKHWYNVCYTEQKKFQLLKKFNIKNLVF